MKHTFTAATLGLTFILSAATQPAHASRLTGVNESLFGDSTPASREELELLELLEPVEAPATASTIQVDPSQLPDLTPDSEDMTMASFILALDRQIERCAGQSATETWTFGKRTVTRKQWCTETLTRFKELAKTSADFKELYARARTSFDWFKSIGRDGKGEVLFTGYYYPTLRGRWTKDDTFKYPLYRKPDDLVQIVENGTRVWRRRTAEGTYVRYYTREEIDIFGALDNKGYEIVYTDDAFANFMLQIQGSGEVMVAEADGTETRVLVNYAAANGQPYVGIGSVLKQKGVPGKYLSLQGMRRYFTENPQELWPTMLLNPSYVFFTRGKDGPYGSAATILVPGHSIAVDRAHFPMGALALYRAKRPMVIDGDDGKDWQPFLRLAVAQDTGGAIKSPGRVDTYWGSGHYAEVVAGQMHQLGELYFAVVPASEPQAGPSQ